jgi:hypothetical protein
MDHDEMMNDIANNGFDDNDEGIDNNFDAFSPTETFVGENGNKYYKKASLSQPTGQHNSVNMWNYLYGSQTGALLKLTFDAVYHDGFDYFPELGIDVPSAECLIACNYAQQQLVNLGLYHTDLNNCTNVKKVGNLFYPIDTNKIIMITLEQQQQQQPYLQTQMQQLMTQYQQQQQQQQQQQAGKKRKSKKMRKRKSKNTRKQKMRKIKR